ncbi:MAG TPA: sulfite exporter TauE/SafE family protein [Bryobacteraceae bacterium]|nr:sulfite exporter TauE/SafE family protein [Bryobacteraceae bacterium]
MNDTKPMGLTAPETKQPAVLPAPVSLTNWKIYCGCFLLAWAVMMFGFGMWPEVIAHWRMAVVMIFGSVVAGSTPMGGGTVAFPILVLVFGQAPASARNFGLIIQALGMTSALIFIACRRVPLPWRLLMGSSAGSVIGMLAGTFLIGPHLPSALVKLLFSCMWMSFGILTLMKNREICGLKGTHPSHAYAEGFAAGLIGGTVAAMIGVGVEFSVYAIMVLIYRSDLKIAIPTAVCAAALASIVGAALHILIGDVGHEAFMNWMAAGPIVIFGAPTGTWLVSVLPRVRVLYFVAGLCIFQFVWTLWQTAHTQSEWIFVAGAMVVAGTTLSVLYRIGKKSVA